MKTAANGVDAQRPENTFSLLSIVLFGIYAGLVGLFFLCPTLPKDLGSVAILILAIGVICVLCSINLLLVIIAFWRKESLVFSILGVILNIVPGFYGVWILKGFLKIIL